MARITLSEGPSLGVLVLALAACDGSSSPTASPPTPIASANWTGTGVAILVSCSPPDQCGDAVIGESFPGRRWGASWSGSSIGFYSEDDDLAYRGTINGWRFVATVSFEGFSGTLEGEFTSDYSSFEALQTSDALSNGIMMRAVHRHQVTGRIQ